MKEWQSQAHVKWECKYHVVILPKYRRKTIYGRLRKRIGGIFRELCRQRGVDLVEGKAMADHVHLLLGIPPKYSVANTVGYLKGKSTIRIHRDIFRTRGNLFGRKFWARGYCVSTTGYDSESIRRYILEQEQLQKEQDQRELQFD